MPEYYMWLFKKDMCGGCEEAEVYLSELCEGLNIEFKSFSRSESDLDKLREITAKAALASVVRYELFPQISLLVKSNSKFMNLEKNISEDLLGVVRVWIGKHPLEEELADIIANKYTVESEIKKLIL